MELTKNLQLKKPAENDFYNVADFNENAEILDTEVQALKDGKLDKTGGDVTGGINTSSYIKFKNGTTDYGQIRVSGSTGTHALTLFGTSDNANGCNLYLANADATTPMFALKAGDGTNSKELKGKPDGTLTWNGGNVITSTGGTMSGRVSFNYTDCPIQQTHTISGKSITMGIGSGGYNRGIFDTDSNRWIVYADQTGNVSLNTTGSTGYTLNCGNDGTLTWKGKDVITSAGGKFTGSVTLMGGDNGIVAPTDNDCIEIEGGTKYGNGAKLTLYGKSATQNGEFRLSAINDGGVNPKHLSGKVDGSLTWADKNIVRSVNGTNADASGNVALSVNPTWTKITSKKASVGAWTITGCTVGKPLFIIGQNTKYEYMWAILTPISGCVGADGNAWNNSNGGSGQYMIGGTTGNESSNCIVVIPSSTTVTIYINEVQGDITLNAFN